MLGLLFITVHGLCAAQAELTLVSRAAPTYSPLARQAQIEGSVVLSYRVRENGTPTEIKLVSGHPILVPHAIENLATWRFSGTTQERLQVTYQFGFIAGSGTRIFEAPEPQPVIEYEGISTVRMTVAYSRYVGIYQCPASPVQPPAGSLASQDYLTIDTGRSKVQAFADGKVLRVYADPRLGSLRAKLPRARAQAMINRFLTTEFWSLCSSYARHFTDGWSIKVEVAVGNQRKSLSDYGEASPLWVRNLVDEIEQSLRRK